MRLDREAKRILSQFLKVTLLTTMVLAPLAVGNLYVTPA